MAAFEVTDNFDGTAGSIAGHTPDISTLGTPLWALAGGSGSYSLAGGLAICQGGNPAAGDGGLGVLALPALTKYSAFVLEAVVATSAAPLSTAAAHNIDLSEIDNGGAGGGLQLILVGVAGSVYSYRVTVRRLLNYDQSGSAQYVDLGILDLTQTLTLRVEATGSSFAAKINGSTVYADSSAIEVGRQTSGAARLTMFQQKTNTVGSLSFTGTIYEPPVVDTFHIRDDFDGSRDSIRDRAPNIIEGAVTEVTWSNATESEWTGSVADAETFGWVLNGNGSVRLKQKGAG